MHALLQQLALSQMEAALCTLDRCIGRCPNDLWDERVGTLTVNQAAFHTLFFADFYLGPSDDVDAFRQQAFHRDEAAAFRDYEEFEPRPPVLSYDRPFLSRYVQHVRRKAIETIRGETAESLAGPSGFTRRPSSRAELHVYNMRHVQHHAAQISLRLRLNAHIDIPWIAHGWRDG